MALQSERLGLPFLAAGQAQKELTHNEALALIDAGLAAAAEGAGLNAPPVDPAPGQAWIVGTAPTGAWVGKADSLACWTGSGWRFVPPTEGMQVWRKDLALWAVRVAEVWETGDVRAGRVVIGEMQVVGGRGAAVALPEGGTVIDLEARATIAALVDRLIAHGLIAV